MDINNLDEHKVHTFVLEKVTGHQNCVVLQATTMDELRTLVEIMVQGMVDCELTNSGINQKKFEDTMQYLFQPYEFEATFQVDEDDTQYFQEYFWIERTEIITMDKFS